MYQEAIEAARRVGLEQYEVSNFCAPGKHSRHNSAGWQGLDYIGIGPGAHGRVTTRDLKRLHRVQHPLPRVWMAQLEAGKSGARKSVEISTKTQLEELLVWLNSECRYSCQATSLRTTEGFSTRDWQLFSQGKPLDSLLKQLRVSSPSVAPFVAINVQDAMVLTRPGLLLADRIIPEVIQAAEAVISLE
jgi:coproporphyrinogen III oxidase-like Fe-S oxidoreductase